jgi:hypothetical protein
METGEKLHNSIVDLSIQPERDMLVGPTESPGLGVEIPQIDFARLMVEFADYEKVEPALITINEAQNTRVRIYGPSELQLTDLDIRWFGTASKFESIFNGSLEVNSISSLGVSGKQVGVVCCGSKFANALLTARVSDPDPDGVIRGVARVGVAPGFAGVHKASIGDWELCHLDGCEVDEPVPAP